MPLTQEETVLKALKAGIMAGEIPVGEFLSQRKLVEQFGTSLITLRAALRRLENDGLIENVPRWGVRVPQDTPDQVRDRYFVRETVEVAAFCRAIPRLDDRKRACLHEMARVCDEVDGKTDKAIYAFIGAHGQFHRSMVAYAESPVLLEQYDRLMARNLMMTNARRCWERGRDRDADHHQVLVQALLTRPEHEACEALRTHIRRGLEHELNEMEEVQ